MTYSLLKLIELMGDDFSTLLNSILNRLPIVVAGIDIELVDDITESLVKLCPHRHSLTFWRDFTSDAEISSVWEEERHDYEITRTIAISFSSNLKLALERIRVFNGWILAVPLSPNSFEYEGETNIEGVAQHLLGHSPNCGILRVHSPSKLEFSTLKPVQEDFEVEKRIVTKILTRQHQSLERIRRLLKKSLRSLKVSEGIISTVITLEDESETLTRDMFEEEINNHVHAARRAVTILSRIRLARELGAPITLTERNLFEAIGWEIGGLTALMQFINAEWHEDFSDCVKSGALSGLGAWVDSMWGA